MMVRPGSRPAAPRHRFPAEWEPHRATWVAWPHNRRDWPGKLDAVQWCYVDIIRQLSQVEPVAVVVADAASERRLRSRLRRAGVSEARLEFHRFPSDRAWLRDTGGTFVQTTTGRRQATTLIDWRFTGWARYPNWRRDDRLANRIARTRDIPTVEAMRPDTGARLVLEGGAIDGNGRGVALATEQCLLDQVVQTRNPTLDRRALETALDAYLGVQQVIWLGDGIVGDDTHGHVDDVARFVGPDTVVAAVEPDPSDPNHAPLADNLRRLRQARVDGVPLKIISLPMPRPVWFDGRRLPASYLNFYIANGLVLVPTFNDPADRTALSRLARVFPNHVVSGIHAVDLVWGLGTLHCLTLQEPAAPGGAPAG